MINLIANRYSLGFAAFMIFAYPPIMEGVGILEELAVTLRQFGF